MNIPTKIEINTFSSINAQLYLVMTEDPRIIKRRLEKRDEKEYNLEVLTNMQNLEVAYSKFIAKQLHKPVLEIKTSNIAETIKFIKKLL